MRIGLTGGAGFIGGHTIESLVRRGHEVVVFDHHGRIAPGVMNGLASHDREAVVAHWGDTRDEVSVTEFAAHVDGIIHLASVLGTQETVGNPRPAVMTNVQSGLNVFEACAQYDIPCVNICVGNKGMANPYSASKTCVESLGEMFVRDRGLRLNQVRAVNAYGPRQVMAAPYGPSRVRKILPAFIARALTGSPIEVYGDGTQVSDMVWVGDVANVLVSALEMAAKGQVCHEILEVGPAVHHQVNEVAEMVVESVQTFGHSGAPIVHLPMRPGETPGANVTVNPDTLQFLGLGAEDLRPLKDGIDRTVQWYIEHWLPGWVRREAP
ncbi:NAD dependent epimerase/dehydratase [Acrocarpospora phusangensis]|uniref:NAD dependent epimerase/dehydratase n=1 Tax=Acrocarpospora phusangensis TaxID=1070424 RepID=A0A919QBF2_9ACTN|nr:NAD-dependent epimerase/dehydratase family protein [Acrocarpospora phusangensis]GIH26084.1 NAD dependent epimerase/dehydratase [Acrocarpospora phusangensis]